MHDLYFTNQILEKVKKAANHRRVTRVEIQLSPKDFLEPKLIKFLFSELSKTTVAEKADLIITVNGKFRSSKIKSIEVTDEN